MKPARFEYRRPADLAEALALLNQHGSDAAVLAGGQSLMPMLNLRLAQPALLVDINAIPGLDAITLTGNRLVIGGRARHNDVLRSDLVRQACPMLVDALSHVAHEAIRNRGTFGGSLALADPSAEIPACAIALDAVVMAASSGGERAVPARDFVHGMYSTALRPEEIITRVEIPVRDGTWHHAFDEVSRRHGDYALAALALAVRLEAGDVVAESRVVFAGVEAHPRRIAAAEAALHGRRLSDLPQLAFEGLAAGLDPVQSAEYPGAYRVRLAATLLRRLTTRLAGHHDRHG